MMKKTFITLLMLSAIAGGINAQRTISSFKDVMILNGNTTTIDGEKYSEPDLYYSLKDDGTYNVTRLTVAPRDGYSAISVPYLNMNTGTGICVNWRTSTTPKSATVKYGTAKDALDKTATASTRKIDNQYFWNTASLEGLEPCTDYYYQVFTGNTGSEVYHFRTAPDKGSKTKTRILVIGDHQRNEYSDYEWMLKAAQSTLKEKYGKEALEDNIDFLLNVGDQVDGGQIALYEKVHRYKSRSISPILANMTTVGNHETYWDSNLLLYQSHYNEYGNLDYNGITSGTAQYYAYQVGRVLFIVLNSDGASTAQKMWVRKVIASASEDPTVDFIVSVQHRPLYAEMYCYDVSDWMRNEIMPILSSTPKHVLNIAGHHHLYARGQMTDTPVYHIISGGGVGTAASGYEQLWGLTPDNYNHDEVQKTIDQWTYQIMEFDPETKEMKVECYGIGNRRLAVDNELVDSFSLRLGQPEPTGVPELTDVPAAMTLPYTFKHTSPLENLFAVQYQIAKDADFNDVVLDKVINAEDFYGATAAYRPLDINAGKDIKEYTVGANGLKNGKYYVRVRNRDANLNWTKYSAVQEFTVSGAADAPQLSLESKYYHPNQKVTVSYSGAPVGKNAWIGLYWAHHKPGNPNDGFNTSTEYKYVTAASGTIDFTVTTPGAYFVVLFGDGGYYEVTDRMHFVVSNICDDSKQPSMSIDKFVYKYGDPVKVSLVNAPVAENDWVGIYSQDATIPKNNIAECYAYPGKTSTGTIILNVDGNYNYSGALPDGEYYVSYFMNNEYYEPMARLPFIVGKPARVETMATIYPNDKPVVLLYEGAPAVDGVELYIDNESGNVSKVKLEETGGSVSVPALEIGKYTVRMVYNGESDLSNSKAFEVVDAAGVNVVIANDKEGKAEYYNISGMRVSETALTPGLYICRKGDKTSKVIVK